MCFFNLFPKKNQNNPRRELLNYSIIINIFIITFAYIEYYLLFCGHYSIITPVFSILFEFSGNESD